MACGLRRFCLLSISRSGFDLSFPSPVSSTAARAAAAPESPGLLKRLYAGERFRAFGYRDFRLVFFGQAGVGAIAAGMLVAVLGAFRGRGMLVAGSGVILGVALVIFALSANVTISLIVAAIFGFSSNYGAISANTMLQTYSDSRMRGRVMGLHGLTMMGVMPLGAMLEGALGSLAGVPSVMCAGGILTAVTACLIAMRAVQLRELD